MYLYLYLYQSVAFCWSISRSGRVGESPTDVAIILMIVVARETLMLIASSPARDLITVEGLYMNTHRPL